MTELEKVREENKELKKENAKLILKLKDCICNSKSEEGTKVIKDVEEVGNVNEPGEVGEEDGDGRGEDLQNEVGEGNAEVIKVLPVKRKLRGKKIKVKYEELSEDIDDPNYSGQSCKMEKERKQDPKGPRCDKHDHHDNHDPNNLDPPTKSFF